ncbi:hypothetical protein D3C72_2378630 [compost metagenome]
MQVIGDAQMAAHKLQHPIVGQVWMSFLAGKQHFHAGDQQEGAKHKENPGELLNQCAAHTDHDRA